MARPGLRNHPKFRRLVFLTKLPPVYAQGHLQAMWDVGYEHGNPVIGDETDIELACEWEGEPGRFFAALRDAGWIDEVGGVFQIHDLFDHAPDYVKKRALRTKLARERKNKELEQKTADNGGQRRTMDAERRQTAPIPSPPLPSPPIIQNTPSPSAPISENGKHEEPYSEAFLRFWEAYPKGTRRTDKPGCWKFWRKERLDPVAEKVIACLEVHKRSIDWTKDNGQFSPMTATWLHRKPWLDEYSAVQGSTSIRTGYINKGTNE